MGDQHHATMRVCRGQLSLGAAFFFCVLVVITAGAAEHADEVAQDNFQEEVELVQDSGLWNRFRVNDHPASDFDHTYRRARALDVVRHPIENRRARYDSEAMNIVKTWTTELGVAAQPKAKQINLIAAKEIQMKTTTRRQMARARKWGLKIPTLSKTWARDFNKKYSMKWPRCKNLRCLAHQSREKVDQKGEEGCKE